MFFYYTGWEMRKCVRDRVVQFIILWRSLAFIAFSSYLVLVVGDNAYVTRIM